MEVGSSTARGKASAVLSMGRQKLANRQKPYEIESKRKKGLGAPCIAATYFIILARYLPESTRSCSSGVNNVFILGHASNIVVSWEELYGQLEYNRSRRPKSMEYEYCLIVETYRCELQFQQEPCYCFVAPLCSSFSTRKSSHA